MFGMGGGGTDLDAISLSRCKSTGNFNAKHVRGTCGVASPPTLYSLALFLVVEFPTRIVNPNFCHPFPSFSLGVAAGKLFCSPRVTSDIACVVVTTEKVPFRDIAMLRVPSVGSPLPRFGFLFKFPFAHLAHPFLIDFHPLKEPVNVKYKASLRDRNSKS
jgi:hypothetical protein